MLLSHTGEIRVEAAGFDASYLLPVRPLGKLRWFGLLPIAFGGLFIWMPARTLSGFLKKIAAGNADPGEWFFLLFLIPFIAGGLIPICVGLLAIYGRCRVEWRERRLSVVEFAGPIRWRRRLPNGPIRKFTVKFGGAKVNDKPVTTGPLSELGALTAEYEQGKPRLVVFGYPRDWLQALAEDLSARAGASAATMAAPEVEVVDASKDEPQFEDVEQKPAGSQVEIQPRANGFSLVIPPAGLRKGNKGLFGFGIIWCLFMAVITGGIVFAGSKSPQSTPWSAWLFIAGFWLIGGSLLTGAVNMGRRRATLSVESDALRVTQTTLFGTKSREWRRGEIAAIRADASGMEVNDVPVIELQVHPTVGKQVGFFAGRDEQELRWLATELRRALNVPAKVN